MQKQLVVTCWFTQNNIALISTHQKLSIRKPAVSSVVAADMLLFFIQTSFYRAEWVVFWNFVEPEGLGSCNQYIVLVSATETSECSKCMLAATR